MFLGLNGLQMGATVEPKIAGNCAPRLMGLVPGPKSKKSDFEIRNFLNHR